MLPSAAPSRRFLSLVLVAWLLPFCVPAAQVEGLYEGRVPVAGEEEVERVQAMGRALHQVLSKLSGVASPRGSAVDAAVAAPQAFMQQFRYEKRSDPTLPLFLWVRFDSQAVDGLVRDAGLPLWSAQRPGLLAWVVVEGGDALDIVAPEAGVDDAGVARALDEQAWIHGVPLAFPLLDLEDRVRVQPGMVLQQDMEIIAEASQRYAPGALLVGRVRADAAGAWIAQWRFTEAQASKQWETRGLSATDTVTGLFGRIAAELAERYAVAAEQAEPGGVRVIVSEVRTLGDYARALEYLQSLDQVSGLSFSGAQGEEFTFLMQVRGGPEALRRLASFGGVFSAIPGAGDDAVVRFRLLP
jgi:hypothetical protein